MKTVSSNQAASTSAVEARLRLCQELNQIPALVGDLYMLSRSDRLIHPHAVDLLTDDDWNNQLTNRFPIAVNARASERGVAGHLLNDLITRRQNPPQVYLYLRVVMELVDFGVGGFWRIGPLNKHLNHPISCSLACSFGQWPVVVCSKRKVLLTGYRWLVCSERKMLVCSERKVLLAGGW
jgi:hypothetical protein